MKIFTFAALLASLLTLQAFIPSEGYQPGDKAIDFKLRNVDGKMISMRGNLKNQGYIIVFTCNTCPVAQAYESRIMALHQQYAAKGYPVIAINSNDGNLSPGDSFDQMKLRSKAKRYPFPYLVDESQDVAKAFGAKATPTAYVVKKVADDYIVSYVGAIDNNRDSPQAATELYVQKAVDALLTNTSVEKPHVRAIGCGIKWKKV